MQKFIWFIKKYKLPLMLAVNTALIFFSHYASWLWIVGSVFNFAFYCCCSLGEILACTMFYEMISGPGTFFIVSVLELFFITTIRYIVDVAKKRKKVYLFPLLLTTLIVVLFSCIHYEVDVEGFYQGAILITFFYSLYYLFIYNKEIDIERCFRFLVFGMLVSLALSVIALGIPNYFYKTGLADGNRIQLFTFNVNHLSMYCLFAVAFFIYEIVNKKGNFWFNAFSIVVASGLGFLPLSKAFLVVYALLMIYLMVFLIIKYRLKSLRVIIPIVIVVGAIFLIFHERLFIIVDRFFTSSDGVSLNSIFTGRVTIWIDYLVSIRSSILKMLFGAGFFTTKIFTAGPHNVYLFVLYRMGFVGVLLIGLLIYSYLKSTSIQFKLTIKNSLLLFTYVILAFEETILSERFMFFLFFALLIVARSNQPQHEVCDGAGNSSSANIENLIEENQFKKILSMRKGKAAQPETDGEVKASILPQSSAKSAAEAGEQPESVSEEKLTESEVETSSENEVETLSENEVKTLPESAGEQLAQPKKPKTSAKTSAAAKKSGTGNKTSKTAKVKAQK